MRKKVYFGQVAGETISQKEKAKEEFCTKMLIIGALVQ